MDAQLGSSRAIAPWPGHSAPRGPQVASWKLGQAVSWATRGPGHSDTGFRVGQGHGTVPWGLQPHVLQGPGEALRVSRHPGRGHGVTATVHSPFCICDDFFMKKKKKKKKQT